MKAACNPGQRLLQAVHDDLRQSRSDLMSLEGELRDAATARATAQAQLRDCQDMLEELQQYATGLQGEGQATAAELEVGGVATSSTRCSSGAAACQEAAGHSRQAGFGCGVSGCIQVFARNSSSAEVAGHTCQAEGRSGVARCSGSVYLHLGRGRSSRQAEARCGADNKCGCTLQFPDCKCGWLRSTESRDSHSQLDEHVEVTGRAAT